MEQHEYENVAALEATHWWYRGLRDAITKLIKTPRFALRQAPRVLDAGCGTGQNLRLLADLLQPDYLGGFDLSARAVEFARAKAPAADIYEGDICDPSVHCEDLDLVLSCDVIVVPGAVAALGGLRRLVEHLRPGGLMILHVAAYEWLFSEHDVVVHTSERFTRSRLRRLLEELGLEVELSSYRCFSIFPAVVAARLPTILGCKPRRGAAESDIQPSGKWTNAVLERVLAAENTAVASGVVLPWGSSLLAVGRKPRANRVA